MNIGITAQTQYADYRMYAIRRLRALNNGSKSTIEVSGSREAWLGLKQSQNSERKSEEWWTYAG